MTDSTTTPDSIGLAAAIDAVNQRVIQRQNLAPEPERKKRLAAPEPRLHRNDLWTVEERISARAKRVEKGALFPCILRQKEVRTSTSGKHYVYVTCVLPNDWEMSHTYFLKENECGSAQEIALAAAQYLERFGYDKATRQFDGSHLLAEIGSWKSADGREHFTVAHLYRDEADRERILAWIEKKKQERAERQQARIEIDNPEI